MTIHEPFLLDPCITAQLGLCFFQTEPSFGERGWNKSQLHVILERAQLSCERAMWLMANMARLYSARGLLALAAGPVHQVFD